MQSICHIGMNAHLSIQASQRQHESEKQQTNCNSEHQQKSNNLLAGNVSVLNSMHPDLMEGERLCEDNCSNDVMCAADSGSQQTCGKL